MRDNSKCITISLPTSTWSHCFVGIEVNLGSVEVGYERYNSKCITISLSTSTWSHCFVGIEGNSESVYIRYSIIM